MKTIGVSMIVRNEAECIEACLESIKEADEIVIVDTGSEDNTVEICRRYTDKVFTDYKWNDDFAEARNRSLDKCTTDWVLIIDADEQLIDTIMKIKTMLNGGFMHKYLGVMFNVQTKTELIKSCRIVKRDKHLRWEQEAHNVLTNREGFKSTGDEEMDLIAVSASLKNRCYESHLLIKSDYSKAHFTDPDRTMRILTKMLKRNPDHTRAMYYMAREYVNRCMGSDKNSDQWHDYNLKVIDLLERHDEICFVRDWTNIYADAMYLLGLAYMGEGRWHDGVMAALKSFMILPSYKAPLYFLSVAMSDTPKTMHRMMEHSKFWKTLSERATNANVAQIRNIN